MALLLLAAQPDAMAHPAPAPGCTADHAAMGHCTMPVVAPPPPPPSCSPEHAAMGHCAMPAPPPPPGCPPEHAAMGHCTLDEPAAPPPAPPVGNAPPPPAPRVDAADAIFGADAMAPVRARLYAEHGGGSISTIMLDQAEVRVGSGETTYSWDGEARFGGDIDKLVIKSEGEGAFGGAFDRGEGQLLWSRAIGPYFDLQTGLRQDVGPGPSPTYAVLGVEGLAPYWFDVEAALFLSDKGDVTARIEGSYDQRITQRLILQPSAELNVALQDVREQGIGAGLSSAELGLRLRYEIAREFAPYLGYVWEGKIGRSAQLARAVGNDPSRSSVVAGIRFWF
ncbi:copper resistance protein B [Sphingopyxis terrae]|uniref:copper resistance protein B n=1 Tax=Sphingopyxis terrae TaxID=33052 RepID=UPI002A1255D3|nr:copper resistance protein B [Sphingopyxis terrae]MDX8357950.1 copper resistance protein B [Sphingopyxis terrae]